MTAVLINIVEVSNVFSVVVVFLVFCVMVVFILRLYGEDFRMTSSVEYNPRLPVQQTPVTAIFNPFAFRLNSKQCNINEIACTVSFQVPDCTLQAFWGVNISDLHYTLSLPWAAVKQRVDDRQFLVDGGCLQKSTVQCFPKCTNAEVNLKPSVEVDPSDFGHPPRSKYPLVILLFSQTEEEEDGTDRRVGAMVNVVHIRDTVCTMASCIIGQYLKMTDGQLSSLKQLFVVSEGEERDAAAVENEHEKSVEDDNVCIICRSTAASRALLPCRHVCTCKHCFSRLDKCPMCRSHIHSYFCVRDEEDDGGERVESDVRRSDTDHPRRSWWARVETWNEWLNQTFGFAGNES